MAINFGKNAYDQYAFVNKAIDKGNFHEVSMTTSRKDKEEGYIPSYWGFTRFVGHAHNKIAQTEIGDRGVRILILSGQSKYESFVDNQGEKRYPKNASTTIFDFDFVGQPSSPQADDDPEYAPIEDDQDDDDEELPF